MNPISAEQKLIQEMNIADVGNIEDSLPVRFEKTVECYYCGDDVPKSQATKTRIEVESGSSGGAWSLGGGVRSSTRKSTKSKFGKSVGVRYNTGRTYYKTITTWVCDTCNTPEEVTPHSRLLKFIMLPFLIAFGIWIWTIVPMNLFTVAMELFYGWYVFEFMRG